MNPTSAPTDRVDSLAKEASTSSDPGSDPRRISFSVRVLLTLFVMLVIVPAWGFAAYLTARYALTEKQSIEVAGRANVRSVASSMNFRLHSLESAMEALALSNSLRADDLNGFYIEAQALAATHRAAVALVTPGGRQLINTGAPNKTDLPSAAVDTKYAQAISTRTVQYSSKIEENASNRWQMSVAAPVIIENEAKYALVVGAPSIVQWDEVLTNLELPKGWAVALIDDKNIISARWPSPEIHIGKPVHPSVASLLTPAESGTGIGTAIDGQLVNVFFHRLKRAPWTVLIGVPIAEIENSVMDAVSPVFVGGLALLLITMLAAWLIGRRFTTELADVAAAATAFRIGQNTLSTVAPSRVRELAELKITLDSATAERGRYETLLKELIGEKELLMREVHHRVKNSLQLVRGILSLQARSATHPEAKSALNDAATRILTVADVHQHLYQGVSTAEVNIQKYLEDLASNLTKSLLDDSPGREVKVTAPHLFWPAEKIIALGLIVAELITNAIKYGEGRVVISLAVNNDQSTTLVVEDEGKGFSEGFEIGNGGGLGSKLIASLVRPDEGSVAIDRTVQHGRVVVSLLANWRRVTSS